MLARELSKLSQTRGEEGTYGKPISSKGKSEKMPISMAGGECQRQSIRIGKEKGIRDSRGSLHQRSGLRTKKRLKKTTSQLQEKKGKGGGEGNRQIWVKVVRG